MFRLPGGWSSTSRLKDSAVEALPPYPLLNQRANPKADKAAGVRRLDTFIGGRFAKFNLSSLVYRGLGEDGIEILCWDAPGRSKPSFEEAKNALDGGQGRVVTAGHKFGPSFILDPSCEAMIFDSRGLPLQGITGGFDYNRRVEYIIPRAEVEAGQCVRYVEVSSNGVFGTGGDPPKDDMYYELKAVRLGSVNMEARRLVWDFETLKQLHEVLPTTSPLGNKALATALKVMDDFDGKESCIKACRETAALVLGQGWEPHVSQDTDTNAQLWAIGYCHIDTAWLWPWSATQQKVARTWSSQVDLSDRYPGFRFMASAAQHYSWLEEYYPALFSKVSDKISEGKMEVNGGCWVEMDGNMPSGESLCRQFLYGQRYFRSRFGKTTDVLVLPDTFGFAPQIPQIARLGGCTSFFTHKLNWNTVNEFPLTSFNWVGLDGSQLLSHITPIGRYDSDCSLAEIVRAHQKHKDLGISPSSVVLFGHGDGGGGPSQIMLERLRRARATCSASDRSGESVPLPRTGVTMSEFFENLRQTTADGKALPDWNGELYLEKHRATYTTQSRTKRNFRKCEYLLRAAENTAALASVLTSHRYPWNRLDAAWEALCLCMFHDTLPGSSIRLAVEDYDRKFAFIKHEAEAILHEALSASTHGKEGEHFVSHLPGILRHEVVKDGAGLLRLAAVDACGRSHLIDPPARGVEVRSSEKGFTLCNAAVSITVEDGRIASLYDQGLKRELLCRGKTAGFVLYEDRPDDGDAWEIEQWTLNRREDLSFTHCDVRDTGGLRGSVDCKLKFGQSEAVVRISLDALSASISATSRSLFRFDVEIDWHERHRLLKFEVPLDIWSQEATYDTAFGVVRRPAHRNTSWDIARFEVPGHKFVDLSEFGYGVALITDCKYGYACQGQTVQMSILRGPTQPDPEADQGRHEFSFALYPHVGTYAESDVQTVAHCFNSPLQRIHGVPHRQSFILDGDSNIILETIKRGEVDRTSINQTVVLRLHEHMGGHGHAKLRIHAIAVDKAVEVNVLEDEAARVDIFTDAQSDYLDLDFRPFEIKSLKLYLSSAFLS